MAFGKGTTKEECERPRGAGNELLILDLKEGKV